MAVQKKIYTPSAWTATGTLIFEAVRRQLVVAATEAKPEKRSYKVCVVFNEDSAKDILDKSVEGIPYSLLPKPAQLKRELLTVETSERPIFSELEGVFKPSDIYFNFGTRATVDSTRGQVPVFVRDEEGYTRELNDAEIAKYLRIGAKVKVKFTASPFEVDGKKGVSRYLQALALMEESDDRFKKVRDFSDAVVEAPDLSKEKAQKFKAISEVEETTPAPTAIHKAATKFPPIPAVEDDDIPF